MLAIKLWLAISWMQTSWTITKKAIDGGINLTLEVTELQWSHLWSDHLTEQFGFSGHAQNYTTLYCNPGLPPVRYISYLSTVKVCTIYLAKPWTRFQHKNLWLVLEKYLQNQLWMFQQLSCSITWIMLILLAPSFLIENQWLKDQDSFGNDYLKHLKLLYSIISNPERPKKLVCCLAEKIFKYRV